LATPPLFVTLAFQNTLEYQNIDESVYSRDDRSTSCTNLVNFGPVIFR